ncbi:MAG: hypothetical protein ABEK50_01500 [bacterium]
MVTQSIEVIDRFDDPRPAREYVYSPVPEDCEIRETRVYKIEGTSSRDELSAFVEDVLVDDVSQRWSLLESGQQGGLEDYDTVVDCALKENVLDLEEEYLIDYCENHLEEIDVDLDDITIVTRYYLRTDGRNGDVVDTVIRDLVNPVIHEWSVRNRGSHS